MLGPMAGYINFTTDGRTEGQAMLWSSIQRLAL